MAAVHRLQPARAGQPPDLEFKNVLNRTAPTRRSSSTRSARVEPGTGRRSRGRAESQAAVPARYLIACANGHLDEFPYVAWVHRGKPCPNAKSRSSGCGSGRATSVRTCRSSACPATRAEGCSRPPGRRPVDKLPQLPRPARAPRRLLSVRPARQADDARRREPVVRLDRRPPGAAARGGRLGRRPRSAAAGAAAAMSWRQRLQGKRSPVFRMAGGRDGSDRRARRRRRRRAVGGHPARHGDGEAAPIDDRRATHRPDRHPRARSGWC